MRLQLVTTLAVVCLANFSVADVISPKNNVETRKIRQLLSFEDTDPKPKDGSVSASEEERFVAAVAVRTGGGPSTNPTPVSYTTPTPSQPESSNSSDGDGDDFWERFKDWLFGDDSD